MSNGNQARLQKHDMTNECVGDYLAMLGTPRALTVYMLYCSPADHTQLVSLDVPVDNWDHLGGFEYVRRSYAATKLLAKSDFLNLGIDRKQVALSGGRDCEIANLKTNRRLRALREGRLIDHDFNGILHTASRIVSRILGTLDRALPRILDYGWTSGRTTAVSGIWVNPMEKYQASLDVSYNCAVLARRLHVQSPLWGATSNEWRVIMGNTATTVPKNAKTDRLICYEPHMNIRYQRAVGEWMKDRLLKVGVNLRDQKPNQVLARRASRWGTHATIDLSSASDTITVELVQALLPPEWFEFLDQLRSHYTTWPGGETLRNEKFSSMGNGFTFELESLCFYALIRAVCPDRRVLVYGDDIIIPVCYYGDVVAALQKGGFSINSKKSFSQGYFRESCGGDFYRGLPLRAPRIEGRINSFQRCASFHNRVFEWLYEGHVAHAAWLRLLRRLRSFSARVHKLPFIPLTPMGSGDDGFYANFEEACPPRARNGWEGWVYRSLIGRLRVAPSVMSKYYEESGDVRGSWGSAFLCAALGPRPPLDIRRSLARPSESVVRRSPPIPSWDWPSVLFVN